MTIGIASPPIPESISQEISAIQAVRLVLQKDFQCTQRVALLARQPNFNLRLFNPTSLRRGVIGPIMEMVVYFKELNTPLDAQ